MRRDGAGSLRFRRVLCSLLGTPAVSSRERLFSRPPPIGLSHLSLGTSGRVSVHSGSYRRETDELARDYSQRVTVQLRRGMQLPARTPFPSSMFGFLSMLGDATQGGLRPTELSSAGIGVMASCL